MSEQLALLRLRAGYAILAGVLLLIGVPLVQTLVLAPTGYLTAVNAIIAHQQFGPLISWTAAHPFESRLSRVFQAIPFLLALGLPGPLRLLLWRGQPQGGRVAVWTGRIGLALFVLALFIGMFTSATSASTYVSAGSEGARQAIALDYAGRYALETLLSRVLGGVLLAIFLMAVGLRVIRVRLLSPWVAYLGILCAALTATTALFFAFGPAQATTPTSGLAYVALALWLIVIGVFLVRLRALPNTSGATDAS